MKTTKGSKRDQPRYPTVERKVIITKATDAAVRGYAEATGAASWNEAHRALLAQGLRAAGVSIVPPAAPPPA